MLPDTLLEPLEGHLRWVQVLHQEDLSAGLGEVYLPDALALMASLSRRRVLCNWAAIVRFHSG